MLWRQVAAALTDDTLADADASERERIVVRGAAHVRLPGTQVGEPGL